MPKSKKVVADRIEWSRESDASKRAQKWGAGPWCDEPDKVQFQAHGYAGLIVRNQMGALCGYVGVPADHPWFDKDYEDVDADVHGGLTFAGRCREDDKEFGICHVPAAGMPDLVWWLGFDCGHAGDFLPSYNRLVAGGIRALSSLFSDGDAYRDVDYVRGEVRRLAEQAAAAASVRA
jgi:hypothetical protein